MPTVIVTTDVPGNVKPCFASSSNVGLTVRSNGEEDTKVLDTNGNMVNAQFPAPANAPVISVIGGSGSQTETFNDASIGPPIYRDGRTYDGQKTFFSPTSKPFLSTDVGSNIFLNGVGGQETDLITQYYSNKKIKCLRTPDTNFGDHQNVYFILLGRNPKSVRSPTANFRPADVGQAIVVDGVADTVATVVSSTEILVTTNNFDATENVTISIVRPVPTGVDTATVDIGWAVFTDGQLTNGSDLLKALTSTPFTPADTQVNIQGHGIANILAYHNSGEVQLDFTSGANITSPFIISSRDPHSIRTHSGGAFFESTDVGRIVHLTNPGFNVDTQTTIASIVSNSEAKASDAFNNIYTTIPNPYWNVTLSVDRSSTPGSNQQWVGYAYVYAATQQYPFVENDVSIGGSVAPRGPRSPIATLQLISNQFAVQVQMDSPPANRPDLDQVWLFRTAKFASEAEARDNAEAGNLFFVTALDATAGGGTITYDDVNDVEGTDKIESDNFGVPVFRYCVYVDPYWWGWGNFPLSVQGTWATNGAITITDGSKWFTGRNNQYVRLENVDSGGIGNSGLWLFKWIDSTHAQLVLADGTNGNVPSSGSGAIVIQGYSTTLYRSKPRNPFSWGFTEILSNGDIVPQLYAFKIGGGLGTAIGKIPNIPFLLLSTEYPAGMFTLDLRLAGTTYFENSLSQLSDFYSYTSHFSQFQASRFFSLMGSRLRQEKIVMWGWDAKNYCIVETDGTSLNVISEAVSKTLRKMSIDRSRQLLAHGAFDSKNQMNCLWLPSGLTVSQVDTLIMNHAPSDQWFIHNDMDVLCSAQFQDGDTNTAKIFVGTETGFVGQAFAEGHYGNWVDPAESYDLVGSATSNSITRASGTFLTDLGYVGNWCLITDPYGENEQWARISAKTSTTLTFDYIIPAIGTVTTAFNPVPAAGWIFYVGLIECRVRRYFNMMVPADDKKLTEIWHTLDGVDVGKITNAETLAIHTGSTFLRYFRDRNGSPFAPKADGKFEVELKRVKFDDSVDTQVWFTQEPPTERLKVFGIEIIDRGFGQWRVYDWTLKVE